MTHICLFIVNVHSRSNTTIEIGLYIRDGKLSVLTKGLFHAAYIVMCHSRWVIIARVHLKPHYSSAIPVDTAMYGKPIRLEFVVSVATGKPPGTGDETYKMESGNHDNFVFKVTQLA